MFMVKFSEKNCCYGMMWFLFSEDYFVFIEIIYVTDIHEVMLRTLIEFFVTDVMKERNFFLRRS